MKKLLSLFAFLVLTSTVAYAQQTPYPAASGTLPYLNAVGGVNLPASPPVLCSLNVGGSFVGTVSFFKNGSALTVSSFTGTLTTTTAPVDTVFTDNAADQITVQMTSYTSGAATWAIQCQEATSFNSGQSSGASLSAANTFTQTNTFANLIDSGLSASQNCISTNGSKQLIASSSQCALLGTAQTFTATQTFPNVIDSGLAINDLCVGTNASSQLSDGTNCAGLSLANTFTATNTFSGANNAFSNAQGAQFSGTGAACPGAGTVLGANATLGSEFAPVCFGPITALNALVIGKIGGTGWGGTTAANSGAIALCANTGAADRCYYQYYTGSTIVNNLSSGAATFQYNGTIDLAVNPLSRTTKIGAGAVCSGTTPLTSPTGNNIACRITAASSTAVLTFGTAYTTNIPICTASDETTSTAAVKVVPTLTTVTLTPPGASDVIDVICIGNGTL